MYLSNSFDEVLSYFISHIDPYWVSIGFPNLYTRVDVVSLRDEGLRPVEYDRVLGALVWLVPVWYGAVDLVPLVLLLQSCTVVEE